MKSIKGKVIKNYAIFDDEMFIVYKDGSCTVISAESDYGGYISLKAENYDNTDSIAALDKRSLGIITDQEYEELRIEKEKKRKLDIIAREKQQLENLAKKLGAVITF